MNNKNTNKRHISLIVGLSLLTLTLFTLPSVANYDADAAAALALAKAINPTPPTPPSPPFPPGPVPPLNSPCSSECTCGCNSNQPCTCKSVTIGAPTTTTFIELKQTPRYRAPVFVPRILQESPRRSGAGAGRCSG